MKWITRTTRLTVCQEKDAIFNPGVTHVEVEDEAAGEFVMIRQESDDKPDNSVAIDPRQWPVLRAAIDRMVEECREEEAP